MLLSYEFLHAIYVGAVHRLAIDWAERGLANTVHGKDRCLDMGCLVLEFEARIDVGLVAARTDAGDVR